MKDSKKIKEFMDCCLTEKKYGWMEEEGNI